MRGKGSARLGLGLLALAIVFSTTVAHAATVTFSGISATDGNDAAGFDVSATAAVGNTLNLGVLPFSITSAGGLPVTMSDALLLTVTAPAGWKIASLTYAESGTYDASGGFVAATTQMLVNGAGPAPGGTTHFGSFGGWGPLGQMVDLSAGTVTNATVSISNQLFAANVATVSKSSATLVAALVAVPVPPAFWMMGGALVALAAVRRRVAQ
ncbi:MAG: hypothetical protein QF609_01170 [Gammaproteobacteria bacterium]|nr:hypothetical protein [Gammaproteobacteria bacterium]